MIKSFNSAIKRLKLCKRALSLTPIDEVERVNMVELYNSIFYSLVYALYSDSLNL
jgi:hypothetical protein